MMAMQKVLIVGAGTMGHGFAQVMATNRLDVSLVDQTEELLVRGRGWITESLTNMSELGHVQKEEIGEILSRIRFTTDLEAAAVKADFVLEAIVENLELKKGLFRELGGFTQPGTIIASNTSSFDINELSAVTAHPERVLGTHWFHPPQITPCVEVIPAEPTSPEITARTIRFLERIGKAPTLCRSAPGFVANRIQVAMAAEALAIVQEGLATPAEVDRIVKSSFGFRLSAYGPFEICDQAGADTYYAIFEYLYGKLKREQFRPPRILAEQVKNGRFGLKTLGGFYDYKDGAAAKIKRERDRKLFARLNLFRQEQE